MSVGNPHEGEVVLRLDKVRRLKFTTRALSKMRGTVGFGWQEFLLRLHGNKESREEIRAAQRESRPIDQEVMARSGLILQTDELVGLLWLGLLHEDKKLLLDDVPDLIDWFEAESHAEREAKLAIAVLEAFTWAVDPRVGRAMRQRDQATKKTEGPQPSKTEASTLSAGDDVQQELASRPIDSGL